MDKTELADCLRQKQGVIAAEAASLIWKNQKELVAGYLPVHTQKTIRDIQYHLQYMAEAVSMEEPRLFRHYLEWCLIIMDQIGIDRHAFGRNIDYVFEAAAAVCGPDVNALLKPLAAAAQEAVRGGPYTTASFLTSDNPCRSQAEHYLSMLLEADSKGALSYVMEVHAGGVPARDIYTHIFQPAQREAGRLWQTRAVTVAQEHYCTAATQLGMSRLYPHLGSGRRTGKTVIAASAGSELHALGIRMVADFFDSAGWDTYYLGANTPADTIIETVKERRPDLVALSATMTFHLDAVTEIIRAVKADDPGQKVLVGGSAFNETQDLWKKTGADGFALDAEEALRTAAELAAD